MRADDGTAEGRTSHRQSIISHQQQGPALHYPTGNRGALRFEIEENRDRRTYTSRSVQQSSRLVHDQVEDGLKISFIVYWLHLVK